MSSPESKTLVAFGEVLWDCLPRGLFLGGAPFNVAYHAVRLGMKGAPVTNIGRDFLGDQVMDRAKAGGMDTSLIQRHEFLTTGVSIASLDASGNASYELREPVAWDDIKVADADYPRIEKADAFVYGSLAARSKSNRHLLDRLLESTQALKLCDVNLRAPYDDLERAAELASRADIVKLNEEELYALSGIALGKELETALQAAQARLRVPTLVVTLGGEGAVLWTGEKVIRETSPRIEVADTIGAGDSFTAAFLADAVKGVPMEQCLRRAVKLGAYVASRDGAQPEYDASDVFGD